MHACSLFLTSHLLSDPSSLGKSRRQNEEPECLGEIPLVETSVARDKLPHAIPIILLMRRT